jgi:hypothetical protein
MIVTKCQKKLSKKLSTGIFFLVSKDGLYRFFVIHLEAPKEINSFGFMDTDFLPLYCMIFRVPV